ncbi:MAG: hypothetical protein H0X02_07315 [Nitrosomonas sp.]|nr:hypothetical protein [Nitrosomonas sp.]
MSKHKVWLIPKNGDGIPQQLMDWDDEDGNFVIQLVAFAEDAVIEVEP